MTLGKIWRLTLGVALALLGSAPARAERKGEAFTFSLRLGPIEGGRARLSIAPPFRDPRGRAIHVLGEAQAVGIAKVLTKLEDRYQLVIDADTLLPRSMSVDEAGYLRTRTVAAAFDGRRAEVKEVIGGAVSQRTGLLPGAPMDPVAALMAMRAARLRDGDRLKMVIVDGAAFYRGEVLVAGREEIQIGDGPRRAIRLVCQGERIRVDGSKVDRPTREALLWLSDDAARVPLRMSGETDLGTAYVELTSHEAPRGPLPVPHELPGVETILSP